VLNGGYTLSNTAETTTSNRFSNTIKLGVLLIIAIVSINGIVVALSRDDNSPAYDGNDDTQNYVLYEGEIFEDFENINDWTADGIGASQEADTSNVMQGNQSLKLTGTDRNIAFTTKTVNIDLSNATNIIFRVYVHDKTTLNSVDFYLSPTADWSTFFSRRIPAYALVNGWNHIVIAKPQFSVVGEASWDSPIVLLRARVQPNEGMDTSVSFDDYRHSYQARPKAIIAFDDACDSIVNAKQIMDENGQVGTVFVIPSYVGSCGYLTLSQLQMFYEAGWDVSNHGYNHLNLSRLSPTDLEYEVNTAHNWLVTNGFVRSANLFAYQYGSYNDNVISVVREQHSLGRTLVYNTYQPQISNFDYDSQYKLKTFLITNTTSVQDIKDRIDEAILQNGLVILTFHQIVNEDTCYDTQCLTCQFKEVSDYLKSREADIDVISLSSLYELYN